MEVVILPSAEAVAEAAARIIVQLVRNKPAAVLGLATGRSQLALYATLVRMHRSDGLDFSSLTTFNLDEYAVAAGHPGSCRSFMHEHFFRHVNLDPRRCYVPDGMAADMPMACAAYEAAIDSAGGIDLQLLGIGADGHIAFNEPSSSLGSRTRMKTLSSATLATDWPGFAAGEQKPRHVVTMGVGTILEARRCLLLATGEKKAKAVAAMIEGPVTAMLPASALQFHPRTVVLLDGAAAGALTLGDYYREVQRLKPEWQRRRDGQ